MIKRKPIRIRGINSFQDGTGRLTGMVAYFYRYLFYPFNRKAFAVLKKYLSCLFAFLMAVSLCAAGQKQYPITAYGAVGDSQTLNTSAIQHTIDLCAKNGGGTVVVPRGVFISGAL